MKQIPIFTLLLAVIASSCTSSHFGSFAQQPTFTTTAPPATCIHGKAFIVDLNVQQAGATDFAVSAVVLSGTADVEIDRVKIPTNGGWFKLPGVKSRLSITPTSFGELKFRLQVQSASGGISDEQFFSTSIRKASDLLTSIQYPEKFVNPKADNPIPIALSLDKSDFDDDFNVSVEIVQGQGNLLYNGTIVNNAYFTLPAGESSLQYRPDVLGEHIIDFTIKAGAAMATERAYVDVFKGIVVNHNAHGTFVVTGTGEYNKEGEEVTLGIDNKGYNFEPEGWYSAAGKLLSDMPTCLMALHAESPDTITLRLKKRHVNINEGESYPSSAKYYTGYPPVIKTVYFKEKVVTIDAKASETITFYHEGYYYNSSANAVRAPRYPYILKNYQTSKEFIRIDGQFHIYLRQKDNPEFKFFDGLSGRYIESSSTRYNVPSSITMQ